MRTAKVISTISYNTIDFLVDKLRQLYNRHIISKWYFVPHFAEEDETKNHIHLLLEPNKTIDTMDLQNEFIEPVPDNKPLKCINFVKSDLDEWILYTSHYPPYLASKMQSRQFQYDKAEYYIYDEDDFDNDWLHAFKCSKWAERNQLLVTLKRNELSPVDLINNGTFPLSMASQLNAYEYMKRHNGHTTRGEGITHD